MDNAEYQKFSKTVNEISIHQTKNFRWCQHCNNGFIADGVNLKMYCSMCKKFTCFGCNQKVINNLNKLSTIKKSFKIFILSSGSHNTMVLPVNNLKSGKKIMI